MNREWNANNVLFKRSFRILFAFMKAQQRFAGKYQ